MVHGRENWGKKHLNAGRSKVGDKYKEGRDEGFWGEMIGHVGS